MQRIMKATIFFIVSTIATTPTMGQQTKETLPAPMPSQIESAQRVFLSNAGGDSSGFYSGAPHRLYDQFYGALKSWGRYDLVSSPAEADLVCEISLVNRFVGDPQFRLVILDPGTRVTLWVLTEHIAYATLLSNRDRNFDKALNQLVDDLRNVAGQPAPPASNNKR